MADERRRAVLAHDLDEDGADYYVPVVSLRDYFAAAALTGLCALCLGAAARAYAMADAMLAARGTHGP
jgi:Na+/glutamate symporter